MGVICFSSLKGGVGKTSLAVNVSAAFAARDCATLLIDLDPAAHSTAFFDPAIEGASGDSPAVSPASSIAQAFLGIDLDCEPAFQQQQIENALTRDDLVRTSGRGNLSVIPAGVELRHFLWGRGARVFKALFPLLLERLRSEFDYIVIDTPPDFNILTRNAIGQSDVVVVPVDPSAMSIRCLEQLIASAEHIKRPAWSIVRTMVNRSATRSAQFTEERLNKNLFLASTVGDEEEEPEFNAECPEEFIAYLAAREGSRDGKGQRGNTAASAGQNPEKPASPIFLLDSVTYRTEQQNRLSFLRKTCFDSKGYASLTKQYLSIVREIEQILGLSEEVLELPDVNSCMQYSYGNT